MVKRLHEDIAMAGIDGSWVFPETPDAIPAVKGAYVLAIHLDAPADISIGRRCGGRLQAGWYLYLGSANGSGGLAARLRRHFRKDKKQHWHIDRLTAVASSMTALAVPEGNECRLVERLLVSARFKTALSGFGSSDCTRCDGHLLMPVTLSFQ